MHAGSAVASFTSCCALLNEMHVCVVFEDGTNKYHYGLAKLIRKI
jgi:hypothetical protein